MYLYSIYVYTCCTEHLNKLTNSSLHSPKNISDIFVLAKFKFELLYYAPDGNVVKMLSTTQYQSYMNMKVHTFNTLVLYDFQVLVKLIEVLSILYFVRQNIYNVLCISICFCGYERNKMCSIDKFQTFG